MWEFFNKLADTNRYGLLTIIFIGIIIIVPAALFILYKVLSKIHIKKLKIGNSEVEIDGNSKNVENSNKIGSSVKTTDMPTFISTLQQIIDYSVENGNQASLKRQQLYDSQMRYIRDKFENIKTLIEFEYTEVSAKTQPIVSVLLKYCFNITIIEKLEHICRADKLIEREKSKLIEEHRSLIDGAYASLINELKKYVTKSTDKGDFGLTFVDESLFELLNKRKNDISEAITDCLQHSWDEANNYFEELKEVRKQLSENVTKALKSYLDSEQHELIPTEWYNYDKLPPNEVVGSNL